jgi:uncharacterized coiled-coil DUF342 family protein
MRGIIACLKEAENQIIVDKQTIRSQQEKIDQLESNATQHQQQISQLINEVRNLTTKTESLASELNRLSGK